MMNPRLTSSKSWTPLPVEFQEKVLSVFENQFKHEAAHGEFLFEGRIYSEEVVLRAGYLEKGRLKQINFEASVDLPTRKKQDAETGTEDTSKKSVMDRIYVGIDALGSLLEEYFEVDDEEELDVPTRWRAYEFEGETVYLQSSTINTRLEDEADRLLGLADQGLYKEEAPSEDALGNAEVDTDLALEVQKAIRSGKYKLPEGFDDESGSEPEPQPN